MTVGRSSFSGRASEHWSASWEIATCRVARVAAAPRLAPVPLGTRRLGFSLQSSAGGDPHGENGRSRGNDGAVSRLTPAAAQVSGANVASRRRGWRRPSWGDRGLRLAADFLAEKFCRARRDALHRRPLRPGAKRLGGVGARPNFLCQARFRLPHPLGSVRVPSDTVRHVMVRTQPRHAYIEFCAVPLTQREQEIKHIT
jgi:hypothetical protein